MPEIVRISGFSGDGFAEPLIPWVAPKNDQEQAKAIECEGYYEYHVQGLISNATQPNCHTNSNSGVSTLCTVSVSMITNDSSTARERRMRSLSAGAHATPASAQTGQSGRTETVCEDCEEPVLHSGNRIEAYRPLPLFPAMLPLERRHC